jgi:hypothetical protein
MDGQMSQWCAPEEVMCCLCFRCCKKEELHKIDVDTREDVCEECHEDEWSEIMIRALTQDVPRGAWG